MDPQKRDERRQHPRYRCEGKAEIHSPGSANVLWGTITDISAGGCYVELASPLPVGQVATFSLTVLDTHLEVQARVAVVHPMFGMGVQFTACPQQEFQKLQEILYQLSGLGAPIPGPSQSTPEPVAEPAAPAAPAPFRISPQEACRILDQIVKHLSQKGTLTKAEFVAFLKR